MEGEHQFHRVVSHCHMDKTAHVPTSTHHTHVQLDTNQQQSIITFKELKTGLSGSHPQSQHLGGKYSRTVTNVRLT